MFSNASSKELKTLLNSKKFSDLFGEKTDNVKQSTKRDIAYYGYKNVPVDQRAGALEAAKKDQLSLSKHGIDAYTQRVYIDKKNAYWWRVRVGNFPSLDQATKVKNQIQKIRGNSIWIDKIK